MAPAALSTARCREAAGCERESACCTWHTQSSPCASRARMRKRVSSPSARSRRVTGSTWRRAACIRACGSPNFRGAARFSLTIARLRGTRAQDRARARGSVAAGAASFRSEGPLAAPNPPGTTEPSPASGGPASAGPAAPGAAEGNFLFLSELLGSPVRGPAGELLGKLVDALAEVEGGFPRVRALRVRAAPARAARRAEWDEVVICEPGDIRLRRGHEALGPLRLPSNEIPLAQDVLDRQIVDTADAQVERVNDLHLLSARGTLRVRHADIGSRRRVRRLVR